MSSGPQLAGASAKELTEEQFLAVMQEEESEFRDNFLEQIIVAPRRVPPSTPMSEEKIQELLDSCENEAEISGVPRPSRRPLRAYLAPEVAANLGVSLDEGIRTNTDEQGNDRYLRIPSPTAKRSSQIRNRFNFGRNAAEKNSYLISPHPL